MNVDIRGWTFTHWWVRPVVKVWFETYHKSVTYSGVEHINWDKPIIFAPSHQNAFSDALCLILPTKYTNNRFIYPLIRADAFGKNTAIDWILTAFHMLPVYRPRDRVNLKEQNESVFGDCYDILAKNRNLLIHPEGNCIPKKKVGRFKKGLARIALGAEKRHNFDLGVTVIPVGINYRQITEARKGIHVEFGKAVPVSQFEESYREHEATAITDLTRRVEEAVRAVTVDYNSVEYQLAEQVVQLKKQSTAEIDVTEGYSSKEVELEKEVIDDLTNNLSGKENLLKSTKQNMAKLRDELDKQHINFNYSLVDKHSVRRLLAEGIGFIIALPLFLYGAINNIVPWLLIHAFANAIEEKQFISSARMLMGLLTFPLFYLAQGAVCWGATGSLWWTVAYMVSLPFSGILSLNLYEKWKDWKQQIRLKLPSKATNDKISGLIAKVLNPSKSNSAAKPLTDSAQS
ncbi:1-acyl-sn-glycerol-3-phosphate acyltransferase [Fodinibius halophilus]|uniref:Phospholipid/glycerol acyltransferase domain-containing protein n=1 Tax=Fodinibius halophilus TaxID=1736908 RepID=A0A6M1T286_9BACT|nr:1-acyl-sn-glycerol-3-phosphate acyltransferase [Fodinibius halophilus]NGP86743.1 hypothetical protein [Fodinibius halophilus]